jgi:hypothetical protein
MAHNTRDSMGIKQETVSQLRNEIITFRVATQHALQKYHFVLLTLCVYTRSSQPKLNNLNYFITQYSYFLSITTAGKNITLNTPQVGLDL